jgi:hypothetical protein
MMIFSLDYKLGLSPARSCILRLSSAEIPAGLGATWFRRRRSFSLGVRHPHLTISPLRINNLPNSETNLREDRYVVFFQ